SLARPPPELLPCRRVAQKLAVDLLRLVGALDDDQLPSWLEPALDPFDRARDDGRPRRGELERAARGGGPDGGVRAPGDVQVDPARRDCLVEGVEGHVADGAGSTDIAPEVAAAEGEVDGGQP